MRRIANSVLSQTLASVRTRTSEPLLKEATEAGGQQGTARPPPRQGGILPETTP